MSAAGAPAAADLVGRSCPYCRFSFKGGVMVVGCPSCRAVHHGECWEENGGCAVLGCVSAPGQGPVAGAPPPPLPPPPPPWPPSGRPGAPPPPPASPTPTVQTAAELAARTQEWLKTPVVSAAGLGALRAAAIMLAAGLLIAIITPDTALTGRSAGDLFIETLRLTVGMTMARFGASGFHIVLVPLILVLVPIAAAAFGAYKESNRTADLPVRARLLAGVATGLPLAVLILGLAALAAKDGLGFAMGSVLLMCVLGGGLGGLLGAARATPDSAAVLWSLLPPAAVRYLGLARIALRPLALLLVLAGCIGVIAWTVQIARGESNATLGRSTATALIESPFYIGEYAVGIASLGAMAQAQPLGEGGAAINTPLPFDDHGDFTDFSTPWRIFAFSDNYAPFAFIFVLILVIGLPLALAAIAGYAVASAEAARTPASGAAHGAAVGVSWALALTLLRAIGEMRWLDANSVFLFVLLTTGVAGIAGGLLAARGADPAVSEPSPAT